MPNPKFQLIDNNLIILRLKIPFQPVLYIQKYKRQIIEIVMIYNLLVPFSICLDNSCVSGINLFPSLKYNGSPETFVRSYPSF